LGFQRFAGPDYNVGPNPGTGPYRRVFTDNASSYNDESAFVTTTCTQSLQSFESGQVYMGGWSSSGWAIDSGLETPNGGGNWEPYMNIEGIGYTGSLITVGSPPSGNRWPCGEQGPSGVNLGTTTIGAQTSGQLVYYAAGASAGSYTFKVQGEYSTSNPGCGVPHAMGSVQGTSWVGNLLSH
jgi:hypothetical protein